MELVKTYLLRTDAELAIATLEGSGISAQLVADDAGGVAPHHAAMQGFRVFVARDDLDRALELLGADS